MKKIWWLMGGVALIVGVFVFHPNVVAGFDPCAQITTPDDSADDIISDDACIEPTSDNSGVLTRYMKVTAPDIISQSIGRYGDTGSDSYTITWDSPMLVKTVNILYTLDDGKTYTEIAADIANTGSFVWNLPDINADLVKIRVSGRGADGHNYGSDLSNAFFVIRNA
jgi:hypothetical protein